MDRRFFIALLGSGLLAPKTLRGDHHVISADPLEVEFDLGSLEGTYTSLEDFYVRNHFAAPAIVESPTLRIEGEVEKPLTLTRDDLSRFGARNLAAVLECAGNRVGSTGLVSNGAWTGFSLKEIVTNARPTSAAAHVYLFGRDGYKRSVPLEQVLTDGVLATHLNSRPLTLRHGAPWRALLAGWYGMDSVKWLERIVLAAAPLPPEGGTYQQSRQAASGELERQPLPRIQVKSVITEPQQGAVLQRGKLEVRGLAWSGTGKIASVEFTTDAGGRWKTANLLPGSDFGWTAWNGSLELSQSGPVEFVSRAIDSLGHAQPAERDPTRLDGYTNNWYHHVHCVVV
jgi:DMSO/TMAO reductase YedYZ molybdopterin-dependent catalytic subunit